MRTCCPRWLSVCLSHLGHLDIEMSLRGLWAQVVFGLWVYIKLPTLVGGKAGPWPPQSSWRLLGRENIREVMGGDLDGGSYTPCDLLQSQARLWLLRVPAYPPCLFPEDGIRGQNNHVT